MRRGRASVRESSWQTALAPQTWLIVVFESTRSTSTRYERGCAGHRTGGRRQLRDAATLIDGRRLADDVWRAACSSCMAPRPVRRYRPSCWSARARLGALSGKKKKVAAAIGFHSLERALPAASTQAGVIAAVCDLADNAAVDGVLVQLPLLTHIDQARVLTSMPAGKDVDGFHTLNMGRLARAGEDLCHDRCAFAVQDTRSFSCKPLAAIALKDRSGEPLAGRRSCSAAPTSSGSPSC